jgi:hypothetical protein
MANSFALLALSLVAVGAEQAKPNILFIVIDDLGFDDVGFRSHEIKVRRRTLLPLRRIVVLVVLGHLCFVL